MTMQPRAAALAIIAVYWTMLVLGMASCIAVHAEASIAAIWTGTVIGTVLGHALVLCNTRAWFAHATILVLAAVLGPSSPGQLSGATMWLAFVPAAMCAYWSLGDRTSLIAFWYPAVIWMLAILDRARPSGVPDDTGIALLGVLALMFIVFLRVREARRIALWSRVAAPVTKLATAPRSTLLKERPGFRIARAGWAVVASALAFAATVWIAPRLWHAESLDPEHEIARTDELVAPSSPQYAGGLPCCHAEQEIEVPRKRVKEYFGVGRGHDAQPAVPRERRCRRCVDVVAATAALAPTYSWTPGGSYTETEGAQHHGGTQYSPEYHQRDVRVRSTTSWDTATGTYDTTALVPTGSVTSETPVVAAAAPEAAPAPVVEPSPFVEPPKREPELAPATALIPDPPPPPPPVVGQQAPSTPAEPPAAPAPRSGPTASPSLLSWIAIVLAAALLLQLGALLLRPVRRWVTLRHLRAPFWQETVDQRVSNAWQLALVGLRDAGWRSDSQESPRDLARRAGIEGVEECAAILERARHGVGIDAQDLSAMTASAQAAYQAARQKLGPVARATTWLRWPLT
jgi:hypothetical protein